MEKTYDVVVIGGGAAGLSAALTLARSRRSVLVVDAGAPRNAIAGQVHGYLGREGTPPGELLAIGRAEAASYGAEHRAGRVTSARAVENGFEVRLDDGEGVRARRLLVATGLVDELPDLPGLAERWGRDVLHCPYCHGWEVRDQAIGILATGPMSLHQAQLFRQLSDDVTLLLHTSSPLDEAQQRELDARGISCVQGEVVALEVQDDRLVAVLLADGRRVALSALVVAPRFVARAELLGELGLQTTELEMAGHVVGSHVPADPTGATTVPGVYVAGNVADLKAQVVVSAAAGLSVAARINADLVAEDVRAGVDRASWLVPRT